MNDLRSDYTTKLYRLASPLFLYLVSFRRKVRKGYSVAAASVEQDLDEIFRRMEEEVKNEMRLETLYREAIYPLAVVADEVLLHSDWEHRDAWNQQHLLEQKFHGSNVGGEEIFRRASMLKDDQVELAAIYFTALSLGTFYSRRDVAPDVKQKLYRQLTEYLVDVKADQLTPDAYYVEPRETVRFSPAITLARVLALGFGLVVLYWWAARLTWSHLVSDLRDLVATILGMV